MSSKEIYLADRFILHGDSGTIDIAHQARTVLRGATAHVSYRRAGNQRAAISLAASACDHRLAHEHLTLSASNDDVTLSWRIGLGPRTTISLTLANRSAQPIFLDDVVVLDAAGVDLGGAATDWRIYQNGWQSWSAAFTRSFAEKQPPQRSKSSAMLLAEPTSDDYRNKHLPYGPAGATVASDSFTVARGSRLSLLAGFISTAQNLSFVRLAANPDETVRLEAVCSGDGMLLPGGAQFVAQTLLLDIAGDPLSLLDLYMSELGATMAARLPETVPTGWCSWYYYFGENTEDDVLANVRSIQEHSLPLDYILLDDGYEAAIGDWTTSNGKFPHGIPWLAAQVRAAGLKPGLWLSPFGVAQNSQIYAEHPDWVLKDADGSAVTAWTHFGVEAPILALDCTNPAVQEWLGRLFRTLAEDWGVDFFKIDFCFAAALPGRRYDPSSTRAMALRKGLEVIREAIGDRFLLGCGMPLSPAVGIVDGMRIGTDVSFMWDSFVPDPSMPATSNALRNVITRYASHGKTWLNDPDCLIARRRNDSNIMSSAETETMAVVLGLSGGMILDGDNLPTLTPARLRLLQKLLPPSNCSAVPLDLFERGLPTLFALTNGGNNGGALLLAAINWDDKARERQIGLAGILAREGLSSLPPLHVYDLLNERYLGRATGAMSTGIITAHGSSLLLFKHVCDHPDLLASTFHILGGMVEATEVTWEQHRLRVAVEKRGRQRGKLAFTIPSGYDLASVTVNGRQRRPAPQPTAQGIVEVTLTVRDRALVELAFA